MIPLVKLPGKSWLMHPVGSVGLVDEHSGEDCRLAFRFFDLETGQLYRTLTTRKTIRLMLKESKHRPTETAFRVVDGDFIQNVGICKLTSREDAVLRATEDYWSGLTEKDFCG
jgi:hypothetical protein